jgi:hypothetical protein
LNHPSSQPPAPDSAPRGLAALRHLLVDDEGGSAAVEFIVLIPVYIMMLGAMFSLALIMLTRQQVVAAARYEAWNMGKGNQRERSDQTIADSFIGYTGTWTLTPAGEKDVEPTKLEDGAEGNKGVEVAKKVLMNEVQTQGTGEKPMRLVKVTGSFAWGGLQLLTGEDMTISTDAAVVLTNEHRRPMFEDNQEQEHAMVSTRSGVGRSASEFDPIGEQDRNGAFTNPVFLTFNEESGTDIGIWKLDARIGGTMESEHGYFRGQMGQ